MTTKVKLKPGEVKKRELTPTQAEKQWISAEDEIKQQKALQTEAAAVLNKHLDKTGADEFKRIERVTADPSDVLDQPAVKIFLGKRLKEFMTKTEPKPRLKRKAS